VPTTAETVPGYEAVTWFGLFTTAGTPREVILKLNAEVQKLFNEPTFRERVIVPNMFESMASSPEQFAAFIKADSEKWSKVLREANIRIE
jgi:tripartite-type tricarboxylate transporter receptor subunit TctC